jgi:hypothetical protein
MTTPRIFLYLLMVFEGPGRIFPALWWLLWLLLMVFEGPGSTVPSLLVEVVVVVLIFFNSHLMRL